MGLLSLYESYGLRASDIPNFYGRYTPPGFGERSDGSQKGLGFLGPLKGPDGRISTELSITVDLNGKEVEIPTLVPTLTQEEINHMLAGNKPTSEIVNKAVGHAIERRRRGMSPFFGTDDFGK